MRRRLRRGRDAHRGLHATRRVVSGRGRSPHLENRGRGLNLLGRGLNAPSGGVGGFGRGFFQDATLAELRARSSHRLQFLTRFFGVAALVGGVPTTVPPTLGAATMLMAFSSAASEPAAVVMVRVRGPK